MPLDTSARINNLFT